MRHCPITLVSSNIILALQNSFSTEYSVLKPLPQYLSNGKGNILITLHINLPSVTSCISSKTVLNSSGSLWHQYLGYSLLGTWKYECLYIGTSVVEEHATFLPCIWIQQGYLTESGNWMCELQWEVQSTFLDLTFTGPCIVNVFLSTTNKTQRYIIFFITVKALHVSSGLSAYHQELKSVHAAPGICQTCLLLPLVVAANEFELMMGRKTAWNM